MMAEPKNHRTHNSKGRHGAKEAQARVDKALVVLALANEPGDAGPCLTDEELALFASESGDHQETARWLHHAGLCPACREQWLLVRQSLEQHGRERGKLYRLSVFRSLRSLWSLRSLGLTLAAAASVAVYLQIQKSPGPTLEPQTIEPKQSISGSSPPPAPEKFVTEEKQKVPVPPATPAAPAARAPAPVQLPEPDAASSTQEKRFSSSLSTAERESASPSAQDSAPSDNEAAPARMAKAAGAHKGVAPQPLQEALQDRDSQDQAELSSSSAQTKRKPLPYKEGMDRRATTTEEMAQWLSALRQACAAPPADGRVWEDLARQGEGFSRMSGDAEPTIAVILGLVRSIGGVDDAGSQCPRILEAIDAFQASGRTHHYER